MQTSKRTTASTYRRRQCKEQRQRHHERAKDRKPSRHGLGRDKVGLHLGETGGLVADTDASFPHEFLVDLCRVLTGCVANFEHFELHVRAIRHETVEGRGRHDRSVGISRMRRFGGKHLADHEHRVVADRQVFTDSGVEFVQQIWAQRNFVSAGGESPVAHHHRSGLPAEVLRTQDGDWQVLAFDGRVS